MQTASKSDDVIALSDDDGEIEEIDEEMKVSYLFIEDKYLLGASYYYVDRQIRCMGAIACHNSGTTEEVIIFDIILEHIIP